jgi:hypothetical protein
MQVDVQMVEKRNVKVWILSEYLSNIWKVYLFEINIFHSSQ